jgi:hypothetical protein
LTTLTLTNIIFDAFWHKNVLKFVFHNVISTSFLEEPISLVFVAIK